jgi:hypothetical protein
MPGHLTRSGFLASAGALALAPSALAGPADLDLAWLRLLTTLELLLVDFYGRVLKTARLGPAGRDTARRARFNETEHLTAVSAMLAGAGQQPPTADEIDFSYPRRAFEAPAHTAVTLEALAAGAYLGAVGDVATATFTLPLARIAANEAQHLSAFGAEATGHALGSSFGVPLALDAASDALGEFAG